VAKLGTPASAHPAVALYRRRERMIRALLHAGCAAAGAVGAITAVYVLAAVSSGGGPVDLRQWIEEQIKGAFGGTGSLLPKGVIDTLALRHPYYTMALLGGTTALVASMLFVGRAYRRFFDTFDPRVLRPIARPRGIAFEGLDDAEALPWTMGGLGARRAAWDELRAWVTEGVSRNEAFGWRVLLGRPGAGKTRMVHELSRVLARRDVLGTHPPPPAGEGWRARAHRRAGRLAAAWSLSGRAYLRGLRGRPEPTDPWDVGDLQEHVLRAASDLLREWRPRRPTLLLLDDPDPGMAKSVLKILLNQSHSETNPFRHPVRLLVVNQALPAELELHRGRWMGSQEPIHLPADARFSDDEIRTLARHVLARPTPLQARGDFAHFKRVTDGNPLLVELTLRWLASRQDDAALWNQPLEEALTREGLLHERAKRICNALATANAGDDALLAAAASTLCGGADTEDLALRFRNFSADRLTGALPPDKDMQAKGKLPPIRPELIGDAFVRAVAAEPPAARLVVRAAWFAEPNGTLRAVLRLSSENSSLGEALREGPPAEWVGSRAKVAQAFVTHHLQNGGDPTAAERQIGSLTPAEAEAMLPWVAEELTVPGHHADEGLACFSRALTRAMDDRERLIQGADVAAAVRSAADAFRAGAERHFDEARDRRALIRLLRRLLARAARAAGTGPREGRTAVRDALGALEEALWDVPELHATVGASVCKRLSTFAFHPPWDRQRLRARARVMRGRGPDALRLAERMQAEFGHDPAAAPAVAQAWFSAVHAIVQRPLRGGASRAEEIARRIAALPGADTDRSIRLDLARTWSAVGALQIGDGTAAAAGRAERCAQKVDALAEGLGDDAVLVEVRLRAWLPVVQALSQGPINLAARAAERAEWMERLAEPFGHHWLIRSRQVRAWCLVIGALSRPDDPTSPADVEALARRVDRLALPFRGDSGFELQRATAWLGVVEAHARTKDAAKAEALAERVDQLAAPFAHRRDFVLVCMKAWSSVEAMYESLPDGRGAENARRAAERIEALAQPFAADREIQEQQLLAWYSRVVALTGRGDTAVIEAAELAARQVDALQARWSQNREHALNRARGWVLIADLYAQLPEGAGVEGAIRCAEAMELALRPFPPDFNCQFLRVRVGAHIASAWASVPEGGCWYQCEGWVQRAEAAAASFFTEPDVACFRAVAWNALTWAHARRPDGVGIERAVQCAEMTESLHAYVAAKGMVSLSVNAWRAVTYAYVMLPSGSGAAAARGIAKRLDGIAGPHWDNETVAWEVALAWTMAAGASAISGHGGIHGPTSAARRVDSAAAYHQGNVGMAALQVEAWRYVADVYLRAADSRAIGVEGLDGLDDVMRHVDALALPFARDEGVSVEHARAWRSVVAAHAGLPGGSGIARAEQALPRVHAITRRFPQSAKLIEVQVGAWTHLVYARARLGDLDGAMELVQEMDTWAAPFECVPDVAIEMADAWGRVVFGCTPMGDASGAARAELCVQRVNALLSPFAHMPEAVEAQLHAWRYLVATYVNVPSGGYPERAAEQARHAGMLAAAHPDHEGIAWTCAEMWRLLACSAARHDALEGRRLSAPLAVFAELFPGSERIRQCVAQVEDRIAQGYLPAAASPPALSAG
jgi:hypothetical protein